MKRWSGGSSRPDTITTKRRLTRSQDVVRGTISTFGDYLGIGAGAHSKLTFAERVLRQVRYRQPREYMARAISGSAVQTDTPVSVGDLPFEFMMNALRLNGGFRTALFEERTGLSLTAVLPLLDEAERRGLISRDHERVAPTVIGQRFLNDLLQIFLLQPSTPSAAACDTRR
jgi:oxygen-independent coproporphyrinogen-3 oxidase